MIDLYRRPHKHKANVDSSRDRHTILVVPQAEEYRILCALLLMLYSDDQRLQRFVDYLLTF